MGLVVLLLFEAAQLPGRRKQNKNTQTLLIRAVQLEYFDVVHH